MEKITSRENAKIKYACRLASSGAFRRSEGKFLAEGRKLCPELCRGAALENFAIFHGGRDNNWGIHADTVVFDESFTAASGPALSAQRWGEGAGTVGGYALFAGGGSSSAASATVDIFTLE